MKYPTRSGLIISPYELGYSQPTEQQLNQRRIVTIHHGWFNRNNYRDNRIHSIFRNLVVYTYPLLADEHSALHHDYDAPIKPKDTLMIDVIEEYLSLNGTIDCIREKRTHEIYHISPQEWEHIRGAREIPQTHQRADRPAYA